MEFILKKWIGGLLMPLPLALTLLLISLCLLFFSQRQTLAKYLTLASFLILVCFSFLPITYQLNKSLERQYSPLLSAAQNFDYILVLGSSGIHDSKLPITSQLSGTALSRFSEALRLYYANPNAKIIVSGSGFGDTQSHAQLLATLAKAYHIPARRIIRLDNTQDTYQEAQQMSAIIKDKKAALVTSATHMSRAMSLFKQYGQTPVPSPVTYLAKDTNFDLPAYTYIPSAYQLNKSEIAIHEYLGKLQRLLLSFTTQKNSEVNKEN